MVRDPDAGQRALDQRFAQDLEWAPWAVERWAGFPVDRVPRPLVLVGPTDWVDGGFVSDAAKLAFHHGMIEAAVPVPEPVLALLRRRAGSPKAGVGTAPLVITAAALSETELVTDRGQRVLPCWRLEAEGADGPIWVLDPDIASTAWAPDEPPSRPRPSDGSPRSDPGAHVILAPDGHTLTFRFIGALPIYEHYPGAEVIESRHAFAIVPVAKDVGPPGIRILPGHGHEVTVRLEEPIAARVFVDRHGHAREVRQSSDK